MEAVRGPIQLSSVCPSDTTTEDRTDGVPHHDGFRTSSAVPEADTDSSSSGPADRSTSGLKVAKPVFHPTLRAMWAGTMWLNMIRQSAYGCENTTVTVRPSWLPVTLATSR